MFVQILLHFGTLFVNWIVLRVTCRALDFARLILSGFFISRKLVVTLPPFLLISTIIYGFYLKGSYSFTKASVFMFHIFLLGYLIRLKAIENIYGDFYLNRFFVEVCIRFQSFIYRYWRWMLL